MKRKILVTLLAFCLIASLCVVGAAASTAPAGDAQTDNDVASITSGETTTYYTAEELKTAIASAQDGAVVTILKDFKVSFDGVNRNACFNITNDIAINGNGYAITAAGTNNSSKYHVINTSNADVTISNLIIDGNNIAKHGIQIYGGTATLTDVESINNIGYGLVVNGSSVTASGLDTSNNDWGGVNVNARTSGNASFKMSSGNLGEQFSVVLDSEASTTNDVTLSGGTYNTVLVNDPDEDGNNRSAGTDNLTITGGTYQNVTVYGAETNSGDTAYITGATVGTVTNPTDGNGDVSVINANVTSVIGTAVVINSGIEDVVPANIVAINGGKQYTDLQTAINEATAGDTVTLVDDVPEEITAGTPLKVDKDITIEGNGKTISLTLMSTTHSSGRDKILQVQGEYAKLTLNNAKLVIKGYVDPANDDRVCGDAIDLYLGGDLEANNSTIDIDGVAAAFVIQTEGETIVLNNTTVTADNVRGNGSQGGEWTVNNSRISFTNCGSHGLSVETADVTNSTITVDGAGLCAVYGKELNFGANTTVNVTNSGPETPTKNWNKTETYYGAVQIKELPGCSLTVESSAIINVSGTNNTVYLPDGAELVNNGTINATVNVPADSDMNVVLFMADGRQYDVQVVNDGDSVRMPTLSKSGYTFTGWRVNDSNTIVRGGESYPITADTTFTAVWNMIMVPDTYDIAVDQPANGAVDVSLSNASQGSVITVTATPDEGYELVYITVDGEPISGNSFVMPDHAVEVSALFAEIGKEVNFVDVSRADWFYDYVQYVAQNGLMEGTTRTAFEPNASMTRAMFWTVLARIDGETITGDAWKTLAQTWAVESGISDGTNADALITREQMVTMLYRYAGSPVAGGMAISEFTDGSSVSDYATDAVTWALSEGILTGMGDGILAPQGTATRAQAAAMLMRFVEA